jgi:hypothetical protein
VYRKQTKSCIRKCTDQCKAICVLGLSQFTMLVCEQLSVL